ncbi:MAG: UDP-N-acetylglucosamine 1-carboxyvinyltransferase, partial [Alphaproteobacteria bacterium]
MDRLRIAGGRRLVGRVSISGAKNAALPLMAASLLSEKPLVLEHVPDLADIRSMGRLVEHLGAECRRDGDRLSLHVADLTTDHAPYDLVRRMRASILVLGPLLARGRRARVALPGGCAIGPRPIDLHLKGLAALGAEIELDAGDVVAVAPAGGLSGARIVFPKISVGATENLLMAAVLAAGETVIANAAREPEVVDLARCLV